MSERILVAIVARTDTPLDVQQICPACKHFVRLDKEALRVIANGGVAVCVVCARDLEQKHPGTFTQESLAKLPPVNEELTAYPSSLPA